MTAPTLDPVFTAMLDLAIERPWTAVSLRDIAAEAGVPLAELFARAAGKPELLSQLSQAFDAAALNIEPLPDADAHDALFDAVMARVEAMEPHRAALIAIARDSAGPSWDGLVFASHFPRTARAILVGAGLDATPPRVIAMTAVWARIARVWRDDEGALNRTMAEIDKQLKTMRTRLNRIRSGF
jgi:AcrR family transcriptional regulator